MDGANTLPPTKKPSPDTIKTQEMKKWIIQQDSPAPQSASWHIPAHQQLPLAVGVYC